MLFFDDDSIWKISIRNISIRNIGVYSDVLGGKSNMTDKEQIASLTHRVYELEREVWALKEVVLGAPQSADSTMPSKNQAGPGVQPAVNTQAPAASNKTYVCPVLFE